MLTLTLSNMCELNLNFLFLRGELDYNRCMQNANSCSPRKVQVQAAQERKNVAALKISSVPRSIQISLSVIEARRYTHTHTCDFIHSAHIYKLLKYKTHRCIGGAPRPLHTLPCGPLRTIKIKAPCRIFRSVALFPHSSQKIHPSRNLIHISRLDF
jgi:hypothetical protein